MRSPSSAPCVNGLVGSTDSTPTVRPSVRRWRQSAETRLDLPEPGGPVRPMWAARPVCGKSERHQLGAARVAVLDEADRSRDGAPVAASTRRASSAGSPARLRRPVVPVTRCSCGCRSHAPAPTIANSTPAAHSSQAAPASRPSENRPSAAEADRGQPQGVGARRTEAHRHERRDRAADAREDPDPGAVGRRRRSTSCRRAAGRGRRAGRGRCRRRRG